MSALKYWDGAAWVTVGGGSSVGNYFNSSVTNQSLSTTDAYVVGSNVAVPTAGGFKALGQYHCIFEVVKSAGTGGIVLTVRVGTTGTISDTARITFGAFGAGTTVADTGTFEVFVNWRVVGASAVIIGFQRGLHQNSSAGLYSGGQFWMTAPVVSSSFDASAATNMGVSFNGSTAFAAQITTVQATLLQ